ncbi:MAG: rRNA maturation RNase YbeY, partial [Candidatus Dormibacteria bacterium]
ASTTRSRPCVASASSSPPGSVASRRGDPGLRVSIIRSSSLTAAQRRVITAAKLGALLRTSADTLGIPSRSSLALRLTNDAELRALNARFLSHDEATDVLAFPAGEPPATRDRRVGDVAISVERAMFGRGEGATSELRLLAVHGLLHCIGHDHANSAGAAAMTAATRHLLASQEVPELEAPDAY